MNWKKIGEVGVDSGQLMITDPCYIDSQWEHEEFKSICYFIFPDGKKEKVTRCSDRWFELIDRANNGELKLEEKYPKPKSNFSYNTCCRKTLTTKSAGQLNYKAGHAGVAVAFSSGYGDGCYPVLARYTDDGHIAEIRIKLIDD